MLFPTFPDSRDLPTAAKSKGTPSSKPFLLVGDLLALGFEEDDEDNDGGPEDDGDPGGDRVPDAGIS